MLLLTAVVFASVGACKGGAVGRAIAPKELTAGEALGADLSCRADQSRATPLVVDWDSSARTDLEVAMRSGIVLARYDCQTLELLPACKAPGGYAFAGVSRKEDVVQIVGRDEIYANFPVGAAELSAGMDRGSSIDLALVTIGKHLTSTYAVGSDELEGDCAGATHFMRSAHVGAFAMNTGTDGKLGAAAEVFEVGGAGASSAYEQTALSRDGELEACASSTPEDVAPPEQCAGILRVELIPITEGTPDEPASRGTASVESLPQTCPEGFALEAGKCSAIATSAAYLCDAEDREGCATQCAAGSVESCYNLARIELDAGETDAGLAHCDQACEGGVLDACAALSYWLDPGVDAERIIALRTKACDGGNGQACRVLANDLERGVLPEDREAAQAFYVRGCNLGDRPACISRAWSLWMVSDDAKGAAEVLNIDCARGNGGSCALLGGWLSQCEAGRPPGMLPGDVQYCERFPLPDPVGATMAFVSACTKGYLGACKPAATRLVDGAGVAVDVPRAIAMLEIGCPRGYYTCGMLGGLYEAGQGVPKDLGKAVEAYTRGCKEGVPASDCYDAGRISALRGDDVLALERFQDGCKRDSKQSCDELIRIYDADGRSEEAKAIYEDVCMRLHHEGYCKAWKKRGGVLPDDFFLSPSTPGGDPDRF